MDDILILTPTRWKLRKAVSVVNKVLASLGLEKHPDKIFIGRIDRGFDFLGFMSEGGPEFPRRLGNCLANILKDGRLG